MKWLQEQQDKLKKLTNLDWKQTFKVGQYQVFGLDIGTSSVKMVQLQKTNGDWSVVAGGISDSAVDEGGEEDSGCNCSIRSGRAPNFRSSDFLQ